LHRGHVRIEDELEQELVVWIACRHHVLEITKQFFSFDLWVNWKSWELFCILSLQKAVEPTSLVSIRTSYRSKHLMTGSILKPKERIWYKTSSAQSKDFSRRQTLASFHSSLTEQMQDYGY
ncbi:hypothetical protein Hamer_G009722, partial [Homarus americanus]